MHAKAREIERRLTEMVAPLVGTYGLILWGIELSLEGLGQIVRIYVDAPAEAAGPEAAPGAVPGATIDQLSKISRGVGVMLDVEDIIPGAYRLEVSSPGLDRVFFSPAQMRGYEGKKLEVRLHEAAEVGAGNRRRFRGLLTGVKDEAIVIESEGASFELPWDAVKKARLMVDDDVFGRQPKKK